MLVEIHFGTLLSPYAPLIQLLAGVYLLLLYENQISSKAVLGKIYESLTERLVDFVSKYDAILNESQKKRAEEAVDYETKEKLPYFQRTLKNVFLLSLLNCLLLLFYIGNECETLLYRVFNVAFFIAAYIIILVILRGFRRNKKIKFYSHKYCSKQFCTIFSKICNVFNSIRFAIIFFLLLLLLFLFPKIRILSCISCNHWMVLIILFVCLLGILVWFFALSRFVIRGWSLEKGLKEVEPILDAYAAYKMKPLLVVLPVEVQTLAAKFQRKKNKKAMTIYNSVEKLLEDMVNEKFDTLFPAIPIFERDA